MSKLNLTFLHLFSYLLTLIFQLFELNIYYCKIQLRALGFFFFKRCFRVRISSILSEIYAKIIHILF